MKKFLLLPQWGWKGSGVVLGVTLVIAVMLSRPIGVSTQYAILDATLLSSLDSISIPLNKESKSAYAGTHSDAYEGFRKSSRAQPKPSSYGLIFFASMVFGGFVASRTQKKVGSWKRPTENAMPI